MIIKVELKKNTIIGAFSTTNYDLVICHPKLTML